jgi:hypothetical protein
LEVPEDYLLLRELQKPFVAMTADRILRELRPLAARVPTSCTISVMALRRRITTASPRRFFARKPYDPEVTQRGVVKGLPLLQAAAE